MTPQEARKELARRELARRQQAQPAQATAQPQSGGLGDTLAKSTGATIEGLANGATLGGYDHYRAGVASLIPWNAAAGGADVRFGDYKGNLEKLRAQSKAVNEQVPIASGASKIAGSIAGAGKASAAGLLPSSAIKGKGLGATTAGLGADGALIAGAESALAGRENVVGDTVQGGLLGAGLNVLTRGAGGAIAPFLKGKKPSLPTHESVKAEADNAYKALRQEGFEVAPERLDDLHQGLNDALPQKLGRSGSGPAYNAIKNLAANKSNPATLDDLDHLQRLASPNKMNATPAELRESGMAKSEITDFVKSLDAEGNLGELLKNAKAAGSRNILSREIDDVLYKGGLPPGSSGDANYQLGQINALRGYLKNNRKALPSDVVEQLETIVKGSKGQNRLRKVGKSAPTNVISQGIGSGVGGAAGFALGGPVGAALGAALVPSVGAIARRSDEAITQKQINDLIAIVRTGSKDAAARPDTKISKALADTEKQKELSRALAVLGITSGSQ